MDDLIYKSVSTLAQAIHDKEISSEELVRACLHRIDKVNPKLNAVVQLAADSALKQAKEADAALARGENVGALHGVPMTIKDSLDTAGVISTGGTLGRANFIPEKDATVVARLKEAGAILLGKTNTPELTLSFETDNLIYGRTNNPYNLERSAGGSSGGAAAIVASGGSPFDIGSDYGGSIRQPSHFCGVAGIKPTSGRVSRTGHIIDYTAGVTESFQQIGPIARTVDDLALLLPIIAGPDGQDPYVYPVPFLDPNDVDLKKLRVVFHTDNGVATPTPDIIQTVKNVAQVLAGQVANIEEDCPEGLDQIETIWRGLAGADGGKAYFDILERAGTKQVSPSAQWITRFEVLSGDAFSDLIVKIARFRSRLLTFMADYDVMICPVNATVAIEHGTLRQQIENFIYTYSYNLTGMPGVVVRAGTSPEGLPIGVQILAKSWREDIALAVAQFVETAFGGWQRPEL